MNTIAIEIQQISKQYPNVDIYAVKPLNLSIQKAEVFGLLGPNGAGKTTLISMLCGLLKPSTGSISINGLSFKQSKKTIQQVIGVVPQEYALYPTLTAFENLMYFGAMFGLKKKDLKEKISQALKDLGLFEYRNNKIDTFSKAVNVGYNAYS